MSLLIASATLLVRAGGPGGWAGVTAVREMFRCVCQDCVCTAIRRDWCACCWLSARGP